MVCMYGKKLLSSNTTNHLGDKCSSTAKKEEHYILKQLKKGVKPCDNFVYYACGNHLWETQVYNRIPYRDDVYTNDDQIIEKLKSHLQHVNKKNATLLERLGKTFYESCKKSVKRGNILMN